MAKKIDVNIAVKDKGSKVVKKFEKTVDKSFKDIQRDAKSTSRSLKRSLGSIATSMKSAITPTRLLGTAIAGLASASVLGYLVKSTLEATSVIKKNAAMAGVSTKAYQELSYAASQYQVDTEALTDAMKELSIRGDEFATVGAGTAVEAFERLGLSADEVSQELKDIPAFLSLISDRINTLDEAAQIRILDELFGGQGAEQMGAFMKAGGKEIDKLKRKASALGMVMSDALIDKSTEAKISIDNLTNTLGIQFATIVAQLAPDITKIAENMGKWVIENKEWIKNDLPKKIENLATALGNVFTGMTKFARSPEAQFMKDYWKVILGAAVGFSIGRIPGAALGVGAGGAKMAYDYVTRPEVISKERIDATRLSPPMEVFIKFFVEDLNKLKTKRNDALKLPASKSRDKFISNVNKAIKGYRQQIEDFADSVAADGNRQHIELFKALFATTTFEPMEPFEKLAWLNKIKKEGLKTSEFETIGDVVNLETKTKQPKFIKPTVGVAEKPALKPKFEKPQEIGPLAVGEAFFQMKDNLEDQRKQLTMTEVGYLQYKAVVEAGIDPLSTEATWIREQVKELHNLKETGKDTFEGLKEATAGWASGFSAQLNEMVWNAKASFADIAESFGKMITQTLIQQSLVDPLVRGISGLNFGSMFDGGGSQVLGTPMSDYTLPSISPFNPLPGRASGGPVAAGQSYIVGEHGREVLNMGNRSGNIASTNQSKGKSSAVVVNVYNNTSTNVDVQETEDSNGSKSIDVIIDEAVANKINQRGSATNKALRSGHSTRTQLIKR